MSKYKKYLLIAAAIFGVMVIIGLGNTGGETAQNQSESPTKNDAQEPEAEAPRSERQTEPDPTEHLVTADEYYQLFLGGEGSEHAYSLKRGLTSCIYDKYARMYGDVAVAEVGTKVIEDGSAASFGNDAVPMRMIEEGAGCTIAEGINELEGFDKRETSRAYSDGL